MAGMVLANITRDQFESCGLGEVLQPHLVISKDEMTESAEAEVFQSRLWGMFNVRLFRASAGGCSLQIRIHKQLLPMDTGAEGGKAAAPGDLLQVMDLAQEEIARNLGEGHRVIHGVAGSGKTLILAYRCQYLARTLQKPISCGCITSRSPWRVATTMSWCRPSSARWTGGRFRAGSTARC
jgi:hypothetical protein